MTFPASDRRIELARAIKAEQVIDHGHVKGMVTWQKGPASEVVVTGRVAEFRRAGLLEGPGATPVRPPYPVRLNAAGKAWLAEHGGGVA